MAYQKVVEPLSLTSLYVESHFETTKLASATAFIIQIDGAFFLITNWHVVSGRNADTQECLDKHQGLPNKLVVYFHKAGCLGELVRKEIALLDEDGNRLWLEHPLSNKVDVAVVQLQLDSDIKLYPIDFLTKDSDIAALVAMPVSIIGYPLSFTSGKWLPIWKTGHIASDHDIDYQENTPAFLIDATTRAGMSGSPVLMRADSYQTLDGNFIKGANVVTRFLGVYSGRLDEYLEIGRVWRPFLIQEIINGRLIFDEESGRRKPDSRNELCPCGKKDKYKNCCGRLN